MHRIDLLGKRCPIPLMNTQRYCMDNELKEGDAFVVETDDPESLRDFSDYFTSVRNYRIKEFNQIDNKIEFIIEKLSE